jgi:hypothetical protein
MELGDWSQVGIFLFGVTAIWTSQSNDREIRRWACILGLCAQPFWLYTTVVASQWGIVFMSVFYTLGWWRGVKTYWILHDD